MLEIKLKSLFNTDVFRDGLVYHLHKNLPSGNDLKYNNFYLKNIIQTVRNNLDVMIEMELKQKLI